MFVFVYLSDARHVGGVGWGVGGMFTFAVTPLTMLFRLCLLFLMFAVTPLTMLFRLCLFLVYLSDGWGGVGWGVGGMFTFAVTPLTMLFRLCLLFLMFAVTPLTMLFRLCLFLVYLSDGWGGVNDQLFWSYVYAWLLRRQCTKSLWQALGEECRKKSTWNSRRAGKELKKWWKCCEGFQKRMSSVSLTVFYALDSWWTSIRMCKNLGFLKKLISSVQMQWG